MTQNEDQSRSVFDVSLIVEKAVRKGIAYARLSTAIDALAMVAFDLRDLEMVGEQDALAIKDRLKEIREGLFRLEGKE